MADGTESKTITLKDLRLLMEAADGFRRERVRLVWRKGRGKVELSRPDEDGTHTMGAGDEVLLEVEPSVPSVGIGSGDPINLTLTQANGKQLALGKVGDALFWSPSALEKFVRPYYARFQDGRYLTELENASREKDVVAILHPPGSVGRAITADEGEPARPFYTLRDDGGGNFSLR